MRTRQESSWKRQLKQERRGGLSPERNGYIWGGEEVELNLLYKWHFASLSFQGLFLPRRQLSGEGVLLENGVSGGGALGESAASCGAGLGSRAVRLTW